MNNIIQISNITKVSFSTIFITCSVILLPLLLFFYAKRIKYFIKCSYYDKSSPNKDEETYAVEDARLSRSERMAALNYVDLDYFDVGDRTLDSTICSMGSSHLSRHSINISKSFIDENNTTDKKLENLDVSSQLEAFETPPSAFRNILPKTRKPVPIPERLK
uniref:Imv membrane protein n=1 Tax=Strongyloides venezuelensis TaxID=75913 RepID=A0A0K0F9N8_STRVS